VADKSVSVEQQLPVDLGIGIEVPVLVEDRDRKGLMPLACNIIIIVMGLMFIDIRRPASAAWCLGIAVRDPRGGRVRRRFVAASIADASTSRPCWSWSCRR